MITNAFLTVLRRNSPHLHTSHKNSTKISLNCNRLGTSFKRFQFHSLIEKKEGKEKKMGRKSRQSDPFGVGSEFDRKVEELFESKEEKKEKEEIRRKKEMSNNDPNSVTIKVPEGNFAERLDKSLPFLYPSVSRTLCQKLVKEGKILVNGMEPKLSTKVKGGDSIRISIDPLHQNHPLSQGNNESNTIDLDNTSVNFVEEGSREEGENVGVYPKWMNGVDLVGEDMPSLVFIHEDEHLAVINKPPGLMVHPSPGHLNGTLVNGLLAKYGKLSMLSGPERPGIVHRLDRDTAGIMVIARTDEAYESLKKQFQERTMVKKYAAVVCGRPQGWNSSESVMIDKAICRHPSDINKMVIATQTSKLSSASSMGKEARTEYKVEKVWNLPKKETFSLLDIQIHTGRTHQIRVHMSSMGTPIVGDPIYCKKHSKHQVDFLLLASKYLEFEHPISHEKMKFSIPLPDHILQYMERLNSSEIVDE
eukprot:TRINITY_DN5014_c0_g3_i2.p1 TRINITY_DN5014_c0_g3~~TRINITY_DN5014_c0_g3_i2.p1  ORF type:complete len:476 (-),score=152.95 TRINITY_DN5014_c0_g3_i2:739-2166(-)